MEKLKGWRTVVFNILTGALAIVESKGLGFGLDPEIITSILVFGNLILRSITTGPVGTKQ